MKNVNYKYIIIFFLIFLCSFFYLIFYSYCFGDVFFCFGFSNNISKGMIIYRDFNVLQTPLYFFLCSFFIKLFGNYLLIMYIINDITILFIMIILFKLIRFKSFLIWPFLLLFSYPTYNYFGLLLLFIVIYLLNNNKNYLLIGFILGLLFLTNQKFGILFIPYFLTSKNKIKSLIVFLIPLTILSIYLIHNNAFYNFIDCCFGSLLDFNENNKLIANFFYVEIVVICYLAYNIIKNRFNDIEAIYILLFQVIIYPIFDLYHFSVVFIPVLYYYLKYKRNFRIYYFLFLVNYVVFFISLFIFKPYINLKNNYLYLVNDCNGLYSFLLEESSKIVLDYDKNYDNSFYFFANSYFIKLYLNKDIDEYDLVLNGNMGYKGDIKRINKISKSCSNSSCVFYLSHFDYSGYCQFNKKIYNYVISNYKKIDSNDYFDIYSN